jgi:hypothetical protein
LRPEKLSHRRERKLSLVVVFPVEDLAVVFSVKVFSGKLKYLDKILLVVIVWSGYYVFTV